MTRSKLISYSAMASALLATTSDDAKSQVVYTDINPDMTFVNDSFEIDFNNDGIIEFTLRQFTTSGGDNYVDLIANTNKGAVSGTAKTYGGTFTYVDADVLNQNAAIGPGNNWEDISPPSAVIAIFYYSYGGYFMGNWHDQTDKYLALRFEIAGNTKYGWIRMDVADSAKSFTVKDMAFEVGGGSLNAGAMATSIQESPLLDFELFTTKNDLRINLPSNERFRLEIIDLNGKLQFASESNSNEIIKHNLLPGVYIARIENTNFNGLKKFVIH